YAGWRGRRGSARGTRSWPVRRSWPACCGSRSRGLGTRHERRRSAAPWSRCRAPRGVRRRRRGTPRRWPTRPSRRPWRPPGRAGGVHMLNLPPVDFEPGVTVMHGKRRVRVREYAPAPDGTGPLVVEIDRTPAGIIKFGRSSRRQAGDALQRVLDRAHVPVVLVSNRPEGDVAALAAELGVATHSGGLSPDDTARF